MSSKIVNPKTGRKINLYGPTYTKLVNEGYVLAHINGIDTMFIVEESAEEVAEEIAEPVAEEVIEEVAEEVNTCYKCGCTNDLMVVEYEECYSCRYRDRPFAIGGYGDCVCERGGYKCKYCINYCRRDEPPTFSSKYDTLDELIRDIDTEEGKQHYKWLLEQPWFKKNKHRRVRNLLKAFYHDVSMSDTHK